MPTMTKVEEQKTAGFVDRGYNHKKKQQRIEEEEREIAKLEALQRGEEVSDEEEEESNGEGLEATQVQTQTDTEQKETNTKTQASEEDDAGLSAEEKSFKKRYGDLRRHSAKKEKELLERIEALEKGTKPANVLPPKSDEDIAQWAKKYPDVAAIVETIAKKKAEEMFAGANQRLQELDRISEEAQITKAENAVRAAHPDFDDLRNSDAFHDWAEAQPKWVQDALYENTDDPQSVVRVIDLYKVDNGLTKTAQKSQARNAASVVGTRNKTTIDAAQTKGTFSESQVAKMSIKEYEANEAAIIESQRTGKFVYDLSGGAR